MVLQLRMETGWPKFYFWDLAYTPPTFPISKIQERSNIWYSSTSRPREQLSVKPSGSVSPCTSQETTLCRLIWVKLNKYAGGYLYVRISEKSSLHAAHTASLFGDNMVREDTPDVGTCGRAKSHLLQQAMWHAVAIPCLTKGPCAGNICNAECLLSCQRRYFRNKNFKSWNKNLIQH